MASSADIKLLAVVMSSSHTLSAAMSMLHGGFTVYINPQ